MIGCRQIRPKYKIGSGSSSVSVKAIFEQSGVPMIVDEYFPPCALVVNAPLTSVIYCATDSSFSFTLYLDDVSIFTASHTATADPFFDPLPLDLGIDEDAKQVKMLTCKLNSVTHNAEHRDIQIWVL